MVTIAIDGPAGAGKSTIAKLVSKQLGYIYVDTGALYRTIGYFVTQGGVDVEDVAGVVALLPKISIELKFKNGVQHVYLNDEDISEKIRTEEISMAASKVSKIPEVRDFLLDMQRDFAKKYNIVMDGRDIGTVVLPDAKVKIFLTADPKVRAQRRYDEQIARGLSVNFDDILEDIKKRDYQDENRDIAPLKPAEDSVIVDSSNYGIDENVAAIIDVVEKKGVKI